MSYLPYMSYMSYLPYMSYMSYLPYMSNIHVLPDRSMSAFGVRQDPDSGVTHLVNEGVSKAVACVQNFGGQLDPGVVLLGNCKMYISCFLFTLKNCPSV